MARLFSNNASSLLAADIDDTVILIDLTPSDGALFPATTSADNDDFMVTVEDSAGNFEIMRCFERVNDRLTVDRAQEGTLAQSFLTGARVEARLTAGTLGLFIQSALGGILDLGPTGILVAGTIRGNTSLTDNQITIPSDGSAPRTGGGQNIFGGDAGGGERYAASHYFLPTGVIQMWSGSVGSIPAGWALCNGQSVGGYITPDLSDKFVKGSGVENPGATGGSSDTGPGGDHDHGGVTGGHALTIAEMAKHSHPYQNETGASQTPGGSIPAGTKNPVETQTGEIGGDQPHTHPVPASGTHTHSNSEPPYYVVAYIIKLPDTETPP